MNPRKPAWVHHFTVAMSYEKTGHRGAEAPGPGEKTASAAPQTSLLHALGAAYPAGSSELSSPYRWASVPQTGSSLPAAWHIALNQRSFHKAFLFEHGGTGSKGVSWLE